VTVPKTKARRLTRADIVAAANTHFCWGDPNPYRPSVDVANSLLSWGITALRERWFPRNRAQQDGFSAFCAGGGRLYLVMGAMDSSLAEITDDMQTWRSSKFVDYTLGISGPNEPNKGENTTWPDALKKRQQVIWDQRVSGVDVCAGALMHNVSDYDGDLLTMVSSGIVDLADHGDFHNYPAAKGPLGNESEVVRARQAYGEMDLWQSETGWTTQQTGPDDQARWVAEAILRGHLREGMAGTIIYEALDNVKNEGQHSGNFGPDWSAWVTPMVTGFDGTREFPGWLADYSKNVPYDGQFVATADADAGWTLYLLADENSTQEHYTLVMPPRLTCSLGKPDKTGDDGNYRWVDRPVDQSLTRITVTG
jgi:hypothetical protein